jgi:hypothetical protein
LLAAEGREQERLGRFLRPFDPALVAENAELQAVDRTGGDLTGPEHAFGAAVEAQHGVDVVVDLSAGDEGFEIGGKGFSFEASDELGELEGVGGDVAERAAGAGARGIAAPVGLLVAGEFGGEPVLCVFDLDDAEVAEVAGLDHRAGLTRHGVAGIVVREDERQAEVATRPARSSACLRVMVIGLSQITGMPALRNSRAMAWWVELGVTMETASMRSARLASLAAIVRKSA